MMDQRATANHAFTRAAQVEHQLLTHYPDAWTQLDHARRHGGGYTWPDWCLLPMGAPAALATRHGIPTAGWHIAALSALYAWRYCHSVYLVEPTLMNRLLAQIPDAIGVEDLTGLPEWCIYIATADAGLWMHLEHDLHTGRPELRVLADLPDGELLPIPIYLDRPSLTEALADSIATTTASLTPAGILPGQDVRGGKMDPLVATLADQIDGYVALATYLARPEADIAERGRPGVRPARRRSPAKGRTVWMVGYSS